jgi:hypothetical protein
MASPVQRSASTIATAAKELTHSTVRKGAIPSEINRLQHTVRLDQEVIRSGGKPDE